MHPKIKPSHLQRIALLYLRQSSPQQLLDHQESPRVQLGLQNTLHQLGFDRVEVIDCDLGKSAAGYLRRPGFVEILNKVCLGQAGAIAAWEASRLARSNFDWQQLIRFCQITGTLVIDESGVYDPTNSDDLAMLGIKATMSEYELNLLAKRARAGLLEKAKRGELHTLLSSGYHLTDDGQYEMDPNEHVRQSVKLVFDKFDELGTIRQVHLWFVENQVEFPIVHYFRGGQRTISWEVPSYQLLRDVLTNPTYAGAYVWGRRQTRTFIREQQPVKTSGHPLPMPEWKVLIIGHHQGYISWEKYLRNQERIRENSNKLSPFSKGAPKMGSSLLTGLMVCGHCGRKLTPKYSGRDGKSVRYICRGTVATTGQTDKCFSTNARKLEQAVVQEALKIIQPAAIDAAMAAEQKLVSESSARQKSLELALEKARYEAERRQRQFDAVDPENRLVLRNLLAQYEQALAEVEHRQQELAHEKAQRRPFDESQRQELYALANDLPRLWNLPATDERSKTRMVRTLIDSIIAKAEPNGDHNCFTIRWTGGVHGEIRLKRNQRGENGLKTNRDVIELVKELAAITDDTDIARILNRCGLKTGHGLFWNQLRVKEIRKAYAIPAFSKTRHETADWIHLRQAAEQLEVSPDAVRRLIKLGIIKAKQIVRHAPWLIARSELKKPEAVDAAMAIKKNGEAKVQINQQQLTLE
jgi:DNA invertase Pin-like site-specific DNA recombinase